MESKLCIHAASIVSECYLTSIVSSLLAGILLCSLTKLFYFIKKKSSFMCDVLVDFTHNDLNVGHHILTLTAWKS